MATTTTTSETIMADHDHNYSLYSSENDGQQQSQLLVEGSVVCSGEELILPPPSCWFTDDLATSTCTSSNTAGTCSSHSNNNNKMEDPRHDLQQQQQGEGDVIICAATNKADCQDESSSSFSYASDFHTTENNNNKRKESTQKAQTAQSVLRASPTSSPRSNSSSTSRQRNHHHHNHNKTPPLQSFRMDPSLSPARVVAAPSPSWKEISSQVLPSAAKELLSSSMRRICYTARLSYSKGRWHRKYSEIFGNNSGYYKPDYNNNNNTNASRQNGDQSRQQQQLPVDLPPFSSLPWIDRQMVREWRTYLPEERVQVQGREHETNNEKKEEELDSQLNLNSSSDTTVDLDMDADTDDFDQARTLVPQPMQRPIWQKAEICHDCLKPFGPTRLRHHCRLCGYSYCQMHSAQDHRLPHLGYDPDVPERVCDPCKRGLLAQNLAERVAWRLARCRDLKAMQLTPYFETGIDTVEEAALRLAHVALATARSIPLGAQATVAVETVEVLRQHGLNGIYGIMLRKEFLAAADLLRKALGINKTAWPLSVHELSAAIFYALAQHRAMRGINPDREEIIHTLVDNNNHDNNGGTGSGSNTSTMTGKGNTNTTKNDNIVIDETDEYNPAIEQLVSLVDTTSPPPTVSGSTVKPFLSGKLQKDTMTCTSLSGLPFTPVCSPVADHVLNSLIFYAPIALTFIYATKEVEMQLLAAQQGWKLLYACLDPEKDGMVTDMPASAVFVHEQQKTACLAVRGTATIHDVVTDVRQMPVSFPEMESSSGSSHPDGWTSVSQGNGLAVCGMASAAMNLFREHIDVLLHLTMEGYRIRITGHSLGGGVATLLGILILKELEQAFPPEKLRTMNMQDVVRVYAYGSPSCVDASLAEFTESFVTTAVLHDDVVPRLTPTSCRGLLKHLLHIRETWVKTHLADDLMAIGERASLAWAPRWRSGFTLTSSSKVALKKSSRSIKRYCQKKIQTGTKHLLAVKEKLVEEVLTATPAYNTPDSSTEEKKHDPSQGETDNIRTGGCADNNVDCDKIAPDSASTNASTLDNSAETDPMFLVEMMGGIDSRTDAVIIDGDEFFEADEALIESDEDSMATTQMFADAMDEARSHEAMPTDGVQKGADNVQQCEPGDNGNAIGCNEEVDPPSNDDDDEGPGAVVLDEIPLPRMFIPGKIVHVYAHRGTYKAAYVPRAFRELRRISLAGNMLSDHTTTAYYESLLEVRSVRHAEERPPRWTAFDEDDTCSCCASRFTWNSTSNSEAQEARDKHNCRSCGTLVCNPCSSKSMPLPSIGITVPVRVCDRCYNDLAGVLTGADAMRNSFVLDEGQRRETGSADEVSKATIRAVADRPERYRERRSVVVDDLARRIQQSTLTSA